MGRTRSVVGRAPAIIIAMAALMISLGGGAYATTRAASHTAARSPSPTAITWSPLTLANGWVGENSVYQSGNPRVSIQTGVVYLSGSLAQPSGGSSMFATLPLAYRPAHNMWITVYTNGGTSGTLYIGHDGTMEAFSSSSCSGTTLNSAECFTSLATVSYPKNS